MKISRNHANLGYMSSALFLSAASSTVPAARAIDPRFIGYHLKRLHRRHSQWHRRLALVDIQTPYFIPTDMSSTNLQNNIPGISTMVAAGTPYYIIAATCIYFILATPH